MSNRDTLASEAEQLCQNLRYRNINPVDCLEYMLAKEEYYLIDRATVREYVSMSLYHYVMSVKAEEKQRC